MLAVFQSIKQPWCPPGRRLSGYLAEARKVDAFACLARAWAAEGPGLLLLLLPAQKETAIRASVSHSPLPFVSGKSVVGVRDLQLSFLYSLPAWTCMILTCPAIQLSLLLLRNGSVQPEERGKNIHQRRLG